MIGFHTSKIPKLNNGMSVLNPHQSNLGHLHKNVVFFSEEGNKNAWFKTEHTIKNHNSSPVLNVKGSAAILASIFNTGFSAISLPPMSNNILKLWRHVHLSIPFDPVNNR